LGARVGIDLTACWRPRVGMVTLSLELSRAMVEVAGADRSFTLFCSGQRPEGMTPAVPAVLSPHRHELANKLLWLPAVEPQAGLDVMFYPYWPPSPRRRRGAPPAVVYVHDVVFHSHPHEVPWQQRLYMGNLVPAALRRCAAVLVPSEATRRDVLDCFPVPGLPDRLHVVPQASFLTGLAPGELPEGLEPGFILAVGTIDPRKNYPRLLRAHRLLRERGPVPPLVVVGRVGWAYGKALEELRSDPEVRLLGHVDDATLLALYRGAGVLAFPSLHEGFGLPLLEAMQEGLPAVISGVSSLPELAGGAAIEVDPLDVEAIAGGLARVLGDRALSRELADRGRERAGGFSWASSAALTLEVLEAASA
jgi:glycosyltransferase involved in cell wall biosynthesis